MEQLLSKLRLANTRGNKIALGCASFLLLICVCSGIASIFDGDDEPADAPTPTQQILGFVSTTGIDATATSSPSPMPTEVATFQPSVAAEEPTPTLEPMPTLVPLTPTHEPPTPTPTPEINQSEAQVVEVIDGDTLRVSIGGQEHNVRLIGIDTPETKDPNSPVMCFGAEATAFTQEMVHRADGKVLLEKDVSETDRFGRLLRYVWLVHPDGQRMLNEELVKQGYAQVSTFPPDVNYEQRFRELMQEARTENRGLWGACGDFGVPVQTPTPVPQPTPTPIPLQPAPPAQVGNCDPSYPDVCIPPRSQVGDLDCGDIPYRRFTVLPPDPHGFDGSDNDGLGCESN